MNLGLCFAAAIMTILSMALMWVSGSKAADGDPDAVFVYGLMGLASLISALITMSQRLQWIG